MYLSFLSIQFFNLLCSSLGNYCFGSQGLKYIYYVSWGYSFILFFIMFYEVILLENNCYIKLFNWFYFDNIYQEWNIFFDPVTLWMLLIINIVSCLVHFYSFDYMSKDPFLSTFLSFLTLFTIFMFFLVTSTNLLQLFIGWEGVGLCSYLLINFWTIRLQANKAALKAMIVNKISDIFILYGLVICFNSFNSWDFEILFSLIFFFLDTMIYIGTNKILICEVISFCFLLGALGKSAQIGLHTWLAEAMEAPTPVSALIHAATMVTAGIFFIIRFSSVFECSLYCRSIIIVLGALMASWAALIGFFQFDLKKIIAYSTCSQLGLMLLICGFSCYNLSFFHLINHAFFKAALFLSAGSIIHAVHGEQDIRKMGGLMEHLPLTFNTVIVASLALIGFPFLSGAFSKENIFFAIYNDFSYLSLFSFILSLITTSFTTMYSCKILWLVFLTPASFFFSMQYFLFENNLYIKWVLIVLSIFCIFFGYNFNMFFFDYTLIIWNNAIFINPINYNLIDAEFISEFIKIMPFIIVFSGTLIISWYYYNLKIFVKITHTHKLIVEFFNKKWFFDRFYNEFLTTQILIISLQWFYIFIDRGLFELIGPYGLKKFLFTSQQRTHLFFNNLFKLLFSFWIIFFCLFLI